MKKCNKLFFTKFGDEKYDMCKAFEDMRLEGYEEGKAVGKQTEYAY